jgi:hypothetical protein
MYLIHLRFSQNHRNIYFQYKDPKRRGLYKNIMLPFKPNTPETMHPSDIEGKLQAVACPPDVSGLF